MKHQLTAVVQELQRLKREGVSAVAVSDDTLRTLRAAIERRHPAPRSATSAAGPATAPVATAAPVNSVREPAPDLHSLIAAAAQNTAPSSSRSMPSNSRASTPASATAGRLPPPPVVQLPAGSKRERWEWLRQRVLDCPVCRQHTPDGCQVVFGVGNIEADIFFCGEAPGGEEEQQGEPFVGPAGRLLTRMIVAMGLRREDVYIGNILNWRPQMEGRQTGRSVQQTGNRPPTEEEMRFGLPYLRAQVEVVQPKVIVALGSTAAEGLLGFGSFTSLGSVRGRWHTFNGTPLMVTYHPSYLLRNASNRTKRIVWEDLLQVMEKVGLPINEKQRGYFL